MNCKEVHIFTLSYVPQFLSLLNSFTQACFLLYSEVSPFKYATDTDLGVPVHGAKTLNFKSFFVRSKCHLKASDMFVDLFSVSFLSGKFIRNYLETYVRSQHTEL